jgi:uncharacterized protein YybS (DUF2232 family)
VAAEWYEFSKKVLAGGVAVSFLTFLAVVFIPFLGAVILIMAPLPVLYYSLKYGRKEGLIVFIASLSAVAVILKVTGSMAALPMLFTAGCMGMILSEVLKKSYSVETTILLPVIALLTIWSAFIFYESTVSGVNPRAIIGSSIEHNIQESIEFYGGLDVPEETINVIRDNIKQISGFFLNIFPAIALIIAAFAVWINVLSARELFQKRALWYPDFGDLSAWKAPEKLVWLFIAGGGTLLVPIEWVRFAGINFLIVCLFVYLLQGISIVSFFFRQKRIPRFFRAMFYFLIFAQQYFTILIVIAGLFDLWIDFRKYIKPVTD